jgi:hypothetical protein
MTAIYTTSIALRKFLVARKGGIASREEMMQIKAAAEAESSCGPIAASTVCGVVVDLDRARLEREWSHATMYD